MAGATDARDAPSERAPDASRTPITNRAFFATDAESLARKLLGCTLVHVDTAVQRTPTRRAGRIVECEAYLGAHDLACHASKGRTPRTDVMFGAAGHAYVYLIYGMYDCFNVVADGEGVAAAVLIRALAPIEGCLGHTDGPGKLCRALAITTRGCNRLDLTRDDAPLFLEPGPSVDPSSIAIGPRIGVDYAGDEWSVAPLRFWLRDEPWVSGVGAGLRRLRGKSR